jgi:hypothetical protein
MMKKGSWRRQESNAGEPSRRPGAITAALGREPPGDRSAVQDVVEPEPEHPEPDVVLGQVHQLAAVAGPGPEHASEVYAALWFGALLAAAGELPDPFPPPIEELARRYFERFPPEVKA